MIYTIGDFETNGLIRKAKYINGKYVDGFMPSPESFAYISVKDDFKTVVDAGVLYFYNPKYIEHKADAEAIHGLTVEFLSKHKEDFVPNCRKLFELFYKGNLVGHNFRGFDSKIGISFLEQVGYGSDVPIGSITDTMFDTSHYLTNLLSKRDGVVYKNKRFKLQDACKMFNISDALINVIHKKYFGFTPEMAWHNATWDTAATFCLFKTAMSKNIIE